MQIISYPFTSEDQAIIKKGLIQQQESIIYPTETYYAVGCVADSISAVEQIYQLKRRTENTPLLVLISGWDMFDRYVGKINSRQKELLEYYWPGALTAILPTKQNLAPALNLTGDTLAFRMTSSVVARELIQLVNTPLVGTSANYSGQAEIDKFDATYRTFGDRVELYIDGGKTPGGAPTTIIDMVGNELFTIVRQGKLVINL